VYFDPVFSEMRERGKSNWSIPEHIKKALKESIVVVNNGNIACTNTGSAEIHEDLTKGGTMYPSEGI
jgi:hypothetical protein